MSPPIGDTLREARISRGLELSDVANETKIRAKYLLAIEEERWSELPSGPYARAFVATYADFLELDPAPLLAEFRRTTAAEEPPLVPETMLPQPGEARRPPHLPIGAIVAVVLAVAVVGIVVAINNGGSDEGGKKGTARQPGSHQRPAQSSTTTTAEATEKPSRVSVELRALGDVWVCLVDDKGQRLIDGETLTDGETRGPFGARAFKVSFGNGSVSMTVDDDQVPVPQLAEPLGYRINRHGAERLSESSRPTCL